MDPGTFVALPQCRPEALATTAALAELTVPQNELEVAGSVCSRRVCGRVMFFELRGAEDSARLQIMLQCSVCGENVYQEVRQQVTVGCSVTFAGTPGLSRRGDLSLVATGYSNLRQSSCMADNATTDTPQISRGLTEATTLAPQQCHILYQDKHIIAVNKPPHLPVHATFGSGRKRARTVGPVDTLLGRLASQLGIPARPRENDGVGLHPVHRLDQDTSGVVLFALDRFSAAKLRSEWHLTTKRYVALADGRVERATWIADAPLRRVQQGSNSTKLKPELNRLQPARTGFCRLAASNVSDSLPPVSLLLATLYTGRTHQIRRHLAGAGTPVVGDGHYGQARTNRHFKGVYGLRRMVLHSAYMRFQHPVTRAWHTVVSTLPSDLTGFLTRLPPLSCDHWIVETSVGPSDWAEGVTSLATLPFRHMQRMPPADDGGDGGSGSEDETNATYRRGSACKHKRRRPL